MNTTDTDPGTSDLNEFSVTTQVIAASLIDTSTSIEISELNVPQTPTTHISYSRLSIESSGSIDANYCLKDKIETSFVEFKAQPSYCADTC